MSSFWQKMGGLYLCNHCKYYSEEEKDKCPNCGNEMLGTQEQIDMGKSLELNKFKKRLDK